MKNNVFWKSMRRQPIVTLLLFLLTGFVSFAFISKTVEHMVVQREIQRISENFKAIGSITTLEDNRDVSEGVKIISQSQYVEYSDQQRHVSGVLADYYNSDIDGYSSDSPENNFTTGVDVGNVLVYGTLGSKLYNEGTEEYFLRIFYDDIDIGYPDYLTEGIGLARLHWDEPLENSPVEELEEGQRYYFRLYFNSWHSAGVQSADRNLYVIPVQKDHWFLPVEEGESIDFSQPGLEEIQNTREVLQENLHAVRLVTVKDMSAIPLLQEEARLYKKGNDDGRWLTIDDYNNANPVCVISEKFARLRGIKLGDTIAIKARDFDSGYLGYITNDVPYWRELATHDLELKVVGTYNNASKEHTLTNYELRVFLPDSCLPQEFGHFWGDYIIGDTFSFKLKSFQDEENFIKENEEKLAAIGMELSMVENSAEEFWNIADTLRQSGILNVAVFSLLIILALGFIVFFHIAQHRREFAIQRALGVSKKNAIRQMTLPLCIVGIIAVFTGGILAWKYALTEAGKTLATIPGPDNIDAAPSVSVLWLVGIVLGVSMVLFLFAIFGARALSKKPVLELLQNTQKIASTKADSIKNQTIAQAKEPAIVEDSYEWDALDFSSISTLPSYKKTKGVAVHWRFIVRQMLRAPIKTLLTVAVAATFIVVLIGMRWIIIDNNSTIDEMYRQAHLSFEVVERVLYGGSNINWGYINPSTVEMILDTGHIESSRLRAVSNPVLFSEESIFDEKENSLVGSKIKNRDVSGLWIIVEGLSSYDVLDSNIRNTIAINFAEGWDYEMLEEDWSDHEECPVIMCHGLLQELGVELGDTLWANSYSNNPTSQRVKIVGVYTGGADEGMINVISPISAIRNLSGDNFTYSEADFKIKQENNRAAYAKSNTFRTIVARSNAGTSDLTTAFQDGGLKENVEPLEKNLSLLSVLYPVTLIISLLVAAGISALLILQQKQEAAVMHVLGNRRGRVVFALCSQQILITALGLLVGMIILLVIMQGSAYSMVAVLLTGGGYLLSAIVGSVLSALFVVSKQPMELLQIKE